MKYTPPSLLSTTALDDLAKKQRDTAAEKKRLNREVKYAKRKRARAMRRVHLLTDEDLTALIEERLQKGKLQKPQLHGHTEQPADTADEPPENAAGRDLKNHKRDTPQATASRQVPGNTRFVHGARLCF